MLKGLGYTKEEKGKTSGSRVMFCKDGYPPILLHKPHPRKELLAYQIRQLTDYEKRGIVVNNTIRYRDYIGSVEFSEDDGIFFGRVQGIRALISYEGENAEVLVEDFHSAVDDYLDMCAEQGIEPEKAYKGSFNVRLTQDLHRRLASYALAKNISLNRLVEEALQEYVVREEQAAYK